MTTTPETDRDKAMLTFVVRQLKLVLCSCGLLSILLLWLALSQLTDRHSGNETPAPATHEMKPAPATWMPPDTLTLTNSPADELIRYGRELVKHTARYLGPRGTVMHISNGMNCQNCHLDAGTKAFGNNYSAVAATYPKFRERSGSFESISKRVNDCFERSLNGKALDTTGREMQAIEAYIRWLGAQVPKGVQPAGAGIADLPYMDRAANPQAGEKIFAARCASCHQPNGQGQPDSDSLQYRYPPLWGPNSYNTGAGLYRISRFAGFVRDNMPLGASHNKTQLSDAEAWDVAAFVNSQPRPAIATAQDWPDVSKKPVDHPFGPYADSFTEEQHKYGPFKPIADARKLLQKKEKS